MKQAGVYFLIISVFISAASCSKEKKGDPDPMATKMAQLTASTWKYSDAGLDINQDGVKENNLPPGILKTCDTDNTITFKSDLTGVIDEGATKCEPLSPQSVPFTWSLKPDGKELTFSTALFAGINGDVKIIELSATKLTITKLVNTTVQGFPVSANVIIFLTH